MNIKKNIWALTIFSIFAIGFYSCSDWTEIEPKNMDEHAYNETSFSETYYEALRGYKKSDHSISFGWFSGWGEPGASTGGMLTGIPDSLDIVSIWGVWYNLSEGKLSDMRFVQEKKGTKVVFASFTMYVGQNMTPADIADNGRTAIDEYWGWPGENLTTDTEDEKATKETARTTAIRKYATAFVDSVYKYGYDGFDMDHEPNYGGGGSLSSYRDRIHIFLSEIREQFDLRGGNKLLLVDGEPQVLKPESGPLVDWMVVQAYTTSGTGTEVDKDNRLNTCINNYAGIMTAEEVTNRYVITENLESAIDALNGGYAWRFRNESAATDKSVCPSLVGMARWEPTNGFRKGGFGGYRFDAESMNKPPYKWMRRAIQAQNPAVK